MPATACGVLKLARSVRVQSDWICQAPMFLLVVKAASKKFPTTASPIPCVLPEPCGSVKLPTLVTTLLMTLKTAMSLLPASLTNPHSTALVPPNAIRLRPGKPPPMPLPPLAAVCWRVRVVPLNLKNDTVFVPLRSLFVTTSGCLPRACRFADQITANAATRAAAMTNLNRFFMVFSYPPDRATHQRKESPSKGKRCQCARVCIQD